MSQANKKTNAYAYGTIYRESAEKAGTNEYQVCTNTQHRYQNIILYHTWCWHCPIFCFLSSTRYFLPDMLFFLFSALREDIINTTNSIPVHWVHHDQGITGAKKHTRYARQGSSDS